MCCEYEMCNRSCLIVPGMCVPDDAESVCICVQWNSTAHNLCCYSLLWGHIYELHTIKFTLNGNDIELDIDVCYLWLWS